MNKTKGCNMKAMAIVVTMCLLMGMTGVFGEQGYAQPDTASIQILPDEYLAPGEKETVKGTGFPANDSARIDLILPSGGTMVGIAYGTTNALGSFDATFSSPNNNGDGYVKASVGSTIISTLVHFTGAAVGDLKISTASTIYSGKNTTITITSTTLNTKNYIIDLTILDPRNIEQTSYFVLHNGIVYATWMFTQVGSHTITALVESLNISETSSVNVQKGSSGGGGGGGGGGGTQNITWVVTRSASNLMIMLDDGISYIETGFITIIYPSMNQTKISISDGVAILSLTESGTYQLRYTGTDGYTTSKTYSFSPSVTLSVSVSSSTNKITISVTVDGTAGSGNVEITKSGDTSSDTASLSSGQTTYTPTESGSYVVSYTYLGKKYSKTVSWTDTPVIDSFTVSWLGGSKVVAKGEVTGKTTFDPMPNMNVFITASFMQKVTVQTDEDGIFEETMDIGNQAGYSTTTLTFTATIGATKKTATVDVKKDVIADYWWVGALGILLLVLVLYFTGTVFKWTGGRHGKPGGSRIRRRQEGNPHDAMAGQGQGY